jgi:hypothetical protein
MSNHPQGHLRRQIESLRQQFLQEGGLPFTDVLSAGGLEEALREIKAAWNDRIFTPLVTLWVFLGQVLNADQSCRAAVARLIAHRVAQGLEPCSSETGAYCQARKRLPERFFSAVARLVGRNLDAQVDRRWLWKGRRVCLFDGSTVSMPDTEENRREYPLAYNQVPGTSFAPLVSGRSSHSRVVRFSTWASAATRARARARSACCASCGRCSAPATSCWGTA